ncbi:MAG: DUF3413 domain-containing protein [Bacteroidales bacterium]|nr:DUF3413 domain-containing protein [Bacteroidales bacterium]
MKRFFSFYLFSVVDFLLVLFVALFITNSASILDACGWLYFSTASISQSAIFALAPFIVALLFYVVGMKRVSSIVHIVLVALLIFFLCIDIKIFSIYRFHINGFVMNMVMGPNAEQIFSFGTKIYLQLALSLVAVVLICLFEWWLAGKMCKLINRRISIITIVALIVFMFTSQLTHAYGAFVARPSVVKTARLIPYNYPLTARSLMRSLGFTPAEVTSIEKSSGDLQYPLHDIICHNPDSLPNIVVIFIDAWSKRSLTDECMPNIYSYAQRNIYYANHRACSNGTRSSIFSTFFSVPDIYWKDFESSHVSPLVIERMLQLGYDMRFYPSATLRNPPFSDVVFFNVPNLRTETEGSTTLERDKRLANDFIADLPQMQKSSNPFFAFLFFDLAHSPELPQELTTKFQPSWTFADYPALSNDADPTPFLNLYRNCCYQIDSFVGEVLKQIEAYDDNTIVIISGDHAQEFNENHKNYWGHNSNFSQWQIAVPFIMHTPRDTARVVEYRTTHYDVVPTLMNRYLGVDNTISDYSVGLPLDSTADRGWHIVGSELNFAFIVQGDTILEKLPDNSLQVYDPNMNEVDSYNINPQKFNEVINKMNRYYKQ